MVGDRCTTKGRGTISGAVAVGGVRIPAGAGGGELSVQTIPAGTVPLGPLSRMEKGKGKERRTAPQPHKFGALTLILQLWKLRAREVEGLASEWKSQALPQFYLQSPGSSSCPGHGRALADIEGRGSLAKASLMAGSKTLAYKLGFKAGLPWEAAGTAGQQREWSVIAGLPWIRKDPF